MKMAGGDYYQEFVEEVACPRCKGRRLSDMVLGVTVGGLNIDEICRLSIEKMLDYLSSEGIGEKGVQYKMPTVEFVGIDPVARTITGRVVPAEGTRIVSIPLKRAFGFYRIYQDENDGLYYKGDDWGEWIYDGEKGFSVDVSNYVSSNGIFKITYGEDVLMEKYPQSCHLFKILLRDRSERLW